jgi:hypothetical protein
MVTSHRVTNLLVDAVLQPVDPRICTATKRDGKPCSTWALKNGSGLCGAHAGLIGGRQHRQADPVALSTASQAASQSEVEGGGDEDGLVMGARALAIRELRRILRSRKATDMAKVSAANALAKLAGETEADTDEAAGLLAWRDILATLRPSERLAWLEARVAPAGPAWVLDEQTDRVPLPSPPDPVHAPVHAQEAREEGVGGTLPQALPAPPPLHPDPAPAPAAA